jgi:flagellar FliL protein
MAEQAVANGTDKDSGDSREAEARSRVLAPSGKRLACLVMLPFLLLGGVGAGGYVMGLFAPSPGHEPVSAEAEARPPAVAAASLHYELPDMLVELKNGGEVPTLLQISAALEVEDQATVERLQTAMPRVLDNFQVYLSALDIEDLSGSAGLDRLSEELLLRVNASIGPAKVRDVKFVEVLVQ